MAGKTELQREILITAYDNRQLTQAEIADRVGCSASYVSNVLGRYDGYDAMDARIEQLNSDLGFTSRSRSTSRDAPVTDDIDMSDVSLEDLSPIGVAAVAGILGGMVLMSESLFSSRPLFRIGIVVVAALIIVTVAGLFYLKVNASGFSEATNWLLGQSSSEALNSSEDAEKTPPAPQSLKDDLYFERADKCCEWCDVQVDSPDVHHIKPREEGGPNRRQNLIVLCPNCHRKADRGMISRSKLRRAISSQT